NFVNFLMGIAVAVQMYRFEEPMLTVVLYGMSFTMLFFANSFLVQLLNHINKFAIPFLIVSAVVLALDYYEYIDATQYTKYLFELLYNHSWLVVFIMIYLFGLIKWCYSYYLKNLSLDSAMVVKKETY